MKQIICILSLVLIFSCSNETANDCFQTAGTIIQRELPVSDFNKILVNRDIELIIKQGNVPKVVVETGKNLINDVTAQVLNEQLILTDNNSCNYVRDYGITKIYVTAPNLIEIRSSTQYNVSSDGVLTYANLTILAEDFGMPNSITSGNFYLKVDNDRIYVVFNNLSNCFISGKTNNLDIIFASGTSRFEGENLIAQHVNLWNRSSNDIIINPQQSVAGKISGTGNVISKNRPPIINVQELYKGRLIFN